MPAQTSMLHVRVDDQLKAKASDALAGVGLTLSDAVRILLTRVAAEGGLPAGLTADPDAYDAWFRAKVQEALDDPSPTTPHAVLSNSIRIERSPTFGEYLSANPFGDDKGQQYETTLRM